MISAGGAFGLQIPGFGMAQRDGGVVGREQQRRGFAHDVAAADDHSVLACDGNAGAFQHFNAAGGRAGQKALLTNDHAAHVHWGEAVHVLVRRDGVDDALFADMPGQRQLHQHAVDRLVRVQRRDFFQKRGLGGFFRQRE